MHHYKAGDRIVTALQQGEGAWSVEERKFHINVLELKAAKLVIMSFTLQDAICNISSHSHGQHESPVILNENGGTENQELTAISKKNWQHLFKRKITITAE